MLWAEHKRKIYLQTSSNALTKGDGWKTGCCSRVLIFSGWGNLELVMAPRERQSRCARLHGVGVGRGCWCVQPRFAPPRWPGAQRCFRETHNAGSPGLTSADAIDLMPGCQPSIRLGLRLAPPGKPSPAALSLVREPSRWSSAPVQERCRRPGAGPNPEQRGAGRQLRRSAPCASVKSGVKGSVYI